MTPNRKETPQMTTATTISMAQAPVARDTLHLAGILTVAARAICGLEPGVVARVRAVRRAEHRTWQGVEPGDVCISLDFDLRETPRAEVEHLLPIGPVYAPKALWVAELDRTLQRVARAARLTPPVCRTRRAEARA